MAVLGICCCSGFFLVAASRGYSLVAVCRLLFAVASLVASHRLKGAWASVVVAWGLRNCASRALEFRCSSCDAQA